MLENLDKDTVEFVPNFDNTFTEPVTLSGYICDLLLNGCSGIAVGMACNLVPHNLNEVYDALNYYIDCMLKDEEVNEAKLFSIIQGPDFPLGGTVIGASGIYNYMRTGNGTITVRANYTEVDSKDKHQIIFTNVPYKVNKADLVSHIDDLIHNGVITEAKEIRDESSKDEIVRIVIDLKKDANKDLLLNKLYAKTQLQTNISINNTVLFNGEPIVANMDMILTAFLQHSISVTLNYITYENNKIITRLNIVNGILKAADNIDEVIRIIKDSEKEFDDLKASNIFDNNEQVNAILDMPLKNISKINKNKYTEQKKDLEEKQAEYEKILTDEKVLLNYIKDKYNIIKKRFGDDRRTTIEKDMFAAIIEDEDLIMEEQIVVSYTTNGIIKCVSETEYKNQKRNGKGVTQNINEADGDMVQKIITMSNKDNLMFFTNTGRCHMFKGYEIPKTGKNARGKHINNYIKFDNDEYVVSFISADIHESENDVVFVTKNGMIKRMSFNHLPVRGVGRVIGLTENDALVDVCIASDNSRLIMITANGMALAVNSEKVRPTGKTARGVKGMKIKDNDEIVKVISEPVGEDTNNFILTVTENGYAKRTDTDEFNSKGRGGAGVKAHKITEATGKIVSALVAEADANILASTKNGQMIRTPMEGFRSQGRSACGVSLMKIEDGDSIASVTVIYPENEEEAEPVVTEAVEAEAPAENVQ